MSEREYSMDAATKIMEHLEAHQSPHYDFDEEAGIIHFSTAVSPLLGQINFHAVIHKSHFLLIGSLPVNADPDNKKVIARMNEFFCRVDSGMSRVHFFFDSSDGDIQARYSVNFDNMELSDEMITNAFACTMLLIRDYIGALLTAMHSDKDICDIIRACEESIESRRQAS